MAKQAGGSLAARRAPPATVRPKAKAITSLAIDHETLTDLKKLAADRRCRVNALIVEAIGALLDRARR